jgi:hypothetical protein
MHVFRMRFSDGSSAHVGVDANGTMRPVAVVDNHSANRPGYRTVDRAADDRRHGAYIARKAMLANAWRQS